jgi:lipoate---protein ligase
MARSQRNVSMANVKTWRLIPLWAGQGRSQMAIDHWLFDQCHQGLHPPVLRFYRWTPAAISLGYHQRQWSSHWQSLRYQDQEIELIRRPTGGRAVLHAGDLTYCIVLPDQSGHRRQTYGHICEFLIRGWRSLGLELQFGTVGRSYQRQANCFGSATVADLITPDGVKFIGSAQAWRGQTVLQHGSMQLQPDLDLLSKVFGAQEFPEGALKTPPLGLGIDIPSDNAIIDALTSAAADHFGVVFHNEAFTASEWKAIQNHHLYTEA